MLDPVGPSLASRAVDSVFSVIGDGDPTKSLNFQVDTQATASQLTLDVGAQTASRTVSLPVLTASGTFAFQNFANVFTQLQTIELGSGALPSYPALSSSIVINGADTTLATIDVRSFGIQGFRGESTVTGGTRAAPAAVPGVLDLLVLAARGYNGTSYTATAAAYVIGSDGTTWSNTNNGTYHRWTGTPDTTTTTSEWMRLQGGNLLIGGAVSIAGTGGLAVAGTTDASSTTSGAIQNSGGMGVAKRSFLGTIGSTFAGNVLAGVQNATTAVSGQVGEVIESKLSTATNAAATGTYLALTSITLTPGDWDIAATVIAIPNGSTVTVNGPVELVVGTTTASNAGSTAGYDRIIDGQPITTGVNLSLCVPAKRVNVSSSTTYFLNVLATFTVGTPQWQGSITARRAR